METYYTMRNPISCRLLSILVTFLSLSILHTTLAATTTASSTKKYTSYIASACSSTTYPKVCYNSLIPYASKIKANPQRLCNTALSVALKAARNASSTISAVSKQKGLTQSEAGIVKDCIENIRDSIDELKQSLNEMGNLGKSDVKLQIDDIKTWVSAAITDEGTCTDGFAERKVSAKVESKIRKSILNVAMPTSNALSIINTLYSY
jgi:pectinesterase inhibitor-like protein